MANQLQFGCKKIKCEGIITADIRTGPDYVQIKIKEGRIKAGHDGYEIICKKCFKPVARISIAQM